MTLRNESAPAGDGARWDDLRRAIRNRDLDGAEKLWLDLLEAGSTDVAPFLDVADLASRQTGGRRHSSVLLLLLADSVKARGSHEGLLRVYHALAKHGSDDGTVRNAAIEAARAAYGHRADFEALLELSTLERTGEDAAPPIDLLVRLLALEPGAYVYHRNGWGVGRVVETRPEARRVTIDFKDRPGHSMEIDSAARMLDRLERDDIRVQAVEDPVGLRKRANDSPLEVLAQALARFGNSAQLKNLKDTLVPEVVAPTRWTAWWKTAKKHALIDPRFVVGEGRDPRVELHEVAQADFDRQIELAMNRSATAVDRQRAIAALATVVRDREDAVAALAKRAERELATAVRSADRVGWILQVADLTGSDPVGQLSEALAKATDPVGIVRAIEDDATRKKAGEGLLAANAEGPENVLLLALEDDPVMADVGLAKWSGDQLERLLAAVDERPALLPNLYAWTLRAQRSSRLKGPQTDPYRHALRVLKVVDAVAYRQRRTATAADKKAVAALCDRLQAQNGAIIRDAAAAADEDGARHLAVLLAQSRAFTPRLLEKLHQIVLRRHPTALRDRRGGEATGPTVAAAEMYMTAAGLARLRTDLEQLTNVEMPANRAEIARAREFGDLKENAEYHAAREKQGMLEAKARQLEADISRARLLTPDIVRTDAVSVGSRVALAEKGGGRREYLLLGPPDADLSRGVLSYQTPLAQALMGKSPGEWVRLDIDGVVQDLEILDIKNGLI